MKMKNNLMKKLLIYTFTVLTLLTNGCNKNYNNYAFLIPSKIIEQDSIYLHANVNKSKFKRNYRKEKIPYEDYHPYYLTYQGKENLGDSLIFNNISILTFNDVIQSIELIKDVNSNDVLSINYKINIIKILNYLIYEINSDFACDEIEESINNNEYIKKNQIIFLLKDSINMVLFEYYSFDDMLNIYQKNRLFDFKYRLAFWTPNFKRNFDKSSVLKQYKEYKIKNNLNVKSKVLKDLNYKFE
jgi:hypothetical protein